MINRFLDCCKSGNELNLNVNVKSNKVSPFTDNPLAQAILREGLEIQDRFLAEPIYSKTGKGYLKSVGVKEIEEAKNSVKKADR